MAKPENLLIGRVHRKLPPEPPKLMSVPPAGLGPPGKFIYREKMHNIYRGGTADMWYSGPQDLWVEWKWENKLPKKLVKPDCSPLQKLWLNGRHVEGRNVCVILGSKDGCVVFTAPYQWLEGVVRDEVLVHSEKQIAEWITEQCGLGS